MRYIFTATVLGLLSANIYAETCSTVSLEYSKYPKLIETSNLNQLKNCIEDEITRRMASSSSVGAATRNINVETAPVGGNGGGCGSSEACPEPGPGQPGVNPIPTPGCGPSSACPEPGPTSDPWGGGCGSSEACPEPGPGQPGVNPIPTPGCGPSSACPEPGPTSDPWGGGYQTPSDTFRGYGYPSMPSGGYSAPSGSFGGY